MRLRLFLLLGAALALGLTGWLTRWGGAPWLEELAAVFAPEGVPPEEFARLQDQVARLGAENVLLRGRLGQYDGIKGEGQVPPERVVVARGRIISRSIRAGRRYAELDIGRVDGIERGMPVVDGWSLAGVVAGTDDGRCLIQWVSDGESRIAARVITSDDDGKPKLLCECICAGTGRRAELQLEGLETGSGIEVSPGMHIVTAGGDGRLPPGLVLGSITAAGRAGGDRWQVVVRPSRDPELAESLLVLRLAK